MSGFAAVEAELVIRLGQDLPAHDPATGPPRRRPPGAATAARHRGGQQPDPRHQLARPDRDRRRLREQQRPGARLGLADRPVGLRSSSRATSTTNSWEKDRPRTCPAEFTTAWRPRWISSPAEVNRSERAWCSPPAPLPASIRSGRANTAASKSAADRQRSGPPTPAFCDGR